MPASWFQFWFKFSRLSYTEGEIGFQAGPWLWTAGVVAVVLVLTFGITYAVTNRYTSNRGRAVSLGLRLCALALLLIPLFEPVLIVPDVVPDENFVAVLVDASESMTIPDQEDDQTRQAIAQAVLHEDDGIIAGLEPHFQLRYYAFDTRATRLDSAREAGTKGKATNLTAALERVIDDFKGIPLSGVVMLTDGGDNSTGVPLNAAEQLRALDVPLHIVGLGQEAFDGERELLDVTVNEGIEETTGTEIDVKVRSWAEGSEQVALQLYRGDEQVESFTQRLKGEGKIDQFTLFYEPETLGANEYSLRIDPLPTEQNTDNNTLDLLIDTRKDTLRVLYFEGQLRWDTKLIKRTSEDDRVIEIVSISRTGRGRLYRQGIRSPDEVAGGFPESREELYAYRAVLFGDVEASFFTLEQLRLIEDFVRYRGGGFAMLGGRNAFADGDYGNTPIANLLPVELDASRRTIIPPTFGNPEGPPDERGFVFAPTAAGFESPILKLAAEPADNRARWSQMPKLTSLNYLGATKPGAVVLAEKPEDDFGDNEPVLIVQRYGRGRTAALATAGTWRWQMLLDSEDTRYQRFWRQFVRWLVAEATDHVDLDLGQTRFAPGDEVPLAVQVFDPTFNGLEGADVNAEITLPTGAVQTLVLQPELTEPGRYGATFVPAAEGVYEVRVTASEGAEHIGEQVRSFLVRPSREEFSNATLKRTLLTSLTETTNGAYYTPADVSALPDNLRNRRTSTSIYEAEPLWDMPLLFGLALLLLCAEWMYRRRKGLP